MRVITTILGLGWLSLAGTAMAQSVYTVTTIGGGPLTTCGPTSGYSGGDTLDESQFNQPYASALDSQGDLFLADHNNNALWEITEPGKAGSQTITVGPPPPNNPRVFTGIMGVATDPANNVYLLLPGLVAEANQFGDYISIASLNSGESGTALAVAQDGTGRVFVSTVNAGAGTGSIWLYDLAHTNGAKVFTGNWQPAGLTLTTGGRLVASDLANNAIYSLATNPPTSLTLVAGGNGVGYTEGIPSQSQFNQPHGVVASSDGHIVVADTGNNRVRLIDPLGNTTLIYGTYSNFWSPNDCSAGEYPGWLDGQGGTIENGASAQSRQPFGVTLSPDGTLYVTEIFYSLLRQVTGTGLASVTTNTLTSTNGVTPPPPTFSPNSGYFPDCVTITVTSTVPTVYFTTDGSAPTTNSATVPLAFVQQNQYVGTIDWCNPNASLSSLMLVAASGPLLSAPVSGQTPTVSQIGFVRSAVAGVGSTAVIPVVANLRAGASLASLQFRVEINPGAGSPPAMDPMALLPISTNDFLPLTGPAPANGSVNFNQTINYTTTAGGQGLFVAALGGSGLSVQNFAVVTLLQVPIPKTAVQGQTYTLSVLFPSGTSDGSQASVPLTNMTSQTLIISNATYFSGDSSPSSGYGAGEFGDGQLDNADVNNAFNASVGIRVPFPFSDAYNAMDAYPEAPGLTGDGKIRFLDWQTILQRSLGLDTNNWIRFWTPAGKRNNQQVAWAPGEAPIPLSVKEAPQKQGVATTPPGQVWFCQASISAQSQVAPYPGAAVSIPVSVNVAPGYNLSGLQFRAIVSANGDAPAPGVVTFTPSAKIPNPISSDGLTENDIVRAWSLGAFLPGLVNSNYLGTINFNVPPSADPGQTYTLRFVGVDGAPNLSTEYQLESFPAVVSVTDKLPPVASLTSDDWKINFFGSVTNSQAADNMDADGDGMSNLQEYLAGTDPTNPQSKLQFSSSGLTGNGTPGVTFSWLTAPGRNYTLETESLLVGGSWAPVATSTGDGYVNQIVLTNYSGNSRFYRIRLHP